MDQSRSHITHAGLPPRLVALLESRQRELSEQGNDAAAYRLGCLIASDAPASWMRELKARRHGDYQRPTVLVGIWRDLDTRAELQRLLRERLKSEQTDLTWQDVRTWLQYVADHELLYREFLMANLLTNLAVLTTRPDERYLAKVASRARAAVEESQAAEALRARGFRHQAAVHTELAFMHLSCARNLAREWTPDAEALIRVVRGSWQLGFLGYGIAAKLVGAALNRSITRWQARYAINS